MKPLEQYLDEVTFEIGGTDLANFGFTLHKYRRETEDKNTVLKIIKEAMRRAIDDAYKEQKKLCAENARTRLAIINQRPKIVVDKDSILNAPSPLKQ